MKKLWDRFTDWFAETFLFQVRSRCITCNYLFDFPGDIAHRGRRAQCCCNQPHAPYPGVCYICCSKHRAEERVNA